MSSEAILKFLEELGASLSATVGQLISAEVTYKAALAEASATPTVWAAARLQEDDSCRLGVGVAERAALVLARAMLSETPAEDAKFGDDDKELLAEFWKQAFGRASTDLKSLLNGRALDFAGNAMPDWQPATAAEIALHSAKSDLAFTVRLSSEMVRRLTAAATPAVPPVAAAKEKPPVPGNLDLLLAVPLAVTLRFGQRQMPLREILELSSGAVIELDRQAEDAVDLLLDERLIARGQVVVVDGCYGLRVTEVCR
jgi:flagellar motor switch protein FliN/FliY